jgi:NADPH-dependent curcumin reductase CurA
MAPDVDELTVPDRTLMGPGPSDVHPRVLRAMSTPLVGHLDPSFLELMDQVQELLRYTFRTDNRWTIPVSGTGSAAMEAAFANLVEPGDTVFVTGAAGAVGSVAGQIAKIEGARVVGFAGSDEKVAFIEDELGFDAGINYKKTDDYEAALAEAAPDGVDAYFDNVGGPITDAVFTQLNAHARVAVCGQISLYNATEQPTGPRKLTTLVTKRARVEGFLVSDFQPRWGEAIEHLAAWLEDGSLQYRETITEGLENAPEAFLGLFEGENIGKQLVKVADY